jgi:hypothetical protein
MSSLLFSSLSLKGLSIMSAPKKAPAKKKISLDVLAAAFAAAEAWLAVHPEAEALIQKLEADGVAWLQAFVAAHTAPAPTLAA